MRIALITREYPPETSWGGIGTFYFSFAQALKDAGCDVEVFTQGTYRPSSETVNGVLVHRVLPRKWLIGGRPGGDLAGNDHLGIFALSLSHEMERTFSLRHRHSPFDIVEGHEHLGINALINMWHGRSLVTVTRYHTAYHSLVSRRLANWPVSAIIRFLEKYSLRSAQYRISASSFIDKITQDDFRNVRPANAIIPLSVETGAPYETSSVKENVVIFVGRMMPGHKNPDMVAQAFVELAKKYPDWRLEFAGMDIALDSGETMWQRCERLLAPCKGRYVYHGVLPRDKVEELYRRARIMVIPSKFESFGLVAQEGMAKGCVPVVSDNTALPEVVGGAGLVFKNGSLDDLVSKLDYLMSNEGALSARSSVGVRRIKEDYSGSLITKMNLDFYKQAMAENRSANGSNVE